MSQQWYLSRQGQRFGPYSWEQLRGFAGSGLVAPEDFAWSDGMPGWVKAAEVEGLFKTTPPPGQSAPPAPPARPAEAPEEQPRPSASSQGQPAGAPGGERIAGIIPGMRHKTGLFSSKIYNLVVTDRRILFAEATTRMLNQAAKDAAAEAKEQGKGFFARAAETMQSQHKIYQKYWQMAPEEILAETPGNFAVEHNQIVSIKIRFGKFNEEQGQYDKDEMQIKTSREKMKLIFEYSNAAKDAKRLLQELLGKAVR